MYHVPDSSILQLQILEAVFSCEQSIPLFQYNHVKYRLS